MSPGPLEPADRRVQLHPYPGGSRTRSAANEGAGRRGERRTRHDLSAGRAARQHARRGHPGRGRRGLPPHARRPPDPDDRDRRSHRHRPLPGRGQGDLQGRTQPDPGLRDRGPGHLLHHAGPGRAAHVPPRLRLLLGLRPRVPGPVLGLCDGLDVLAVLGGHRHHRGHRRRAVHVVLDPRQLPAVGLRADLHGHPLRRQPDLREALR